MKNARKKNEATIVVFCEEWWCLALMHNGKWKTHTHKGSIIHFNALAMHIFLFCRKRKEACRG
jgi:hypothetical protein